jgi:hypothetical protein
MMPSMRSWSRSLLVISLVTSAATSVAAERAEPEDAAVNDAGLPLPPSDEPGEYAAWLRRLPRAKQRAIARYCRAHPREYDVVCGGIGPLHIPMPPSQMPPSQGMEREASAWAGRDEWLASLSRAQRRYVRQFCQGEEEMFTDLCGATPLVVAFDDQPITFTAGGRFAFLPGDPVATDWPTAATPWIALDRDHDGAISSGAELFGGNTVLPSGKTARHGFEALAALDANHDRRLDAADPAFADLLLWSDVDGDRRSTPDELRPLASALPWLPVDHQVAPRCDARGNCERERATMTWLDGAQPRAATIVDVYLRIR